jgi:hypothetical protein
VGGGVKFRTTIERSFAMGRIVVTEFVSLDGVMQAPGGERFKYQGWTFKFDRGENGNLRELCRRLAAAHG